jgi:hypothetical protein
MKNMMTNNSSTKGPVFIAGPERSGTSLIYALLASHPNIAMSRRTNMWTHYYNQYGDISKTENFERCLSMMMRYKRLHKLNPDPERVRHEFMQGKRTYARLFALLEEHFAEQLDKPRWGDKSLNTERYTDLIFAAYPGARIIHMVRDPRDRYASSLKRWKVSRSGIGGATALWLTTIGLAERNQARFPEQYMIIRYEDLVAQPEKKLREICTFIDEEYVSEMLSMQGAKQFRDKGGNSSYGSREPGKISASSVGKFQQVLSPIQVVFMQFFAQKSMRAYSYQPVKTKLRFGDRLRCVLFEFPFNIMRMLMWWIREFVLNRIGRDVPSERIVSEKEAFTRQHKGSIV